MSEQTADSTETEQLRRELAGAHHRIGEMEHKLSEVERQRDEAREMVAAWDRRGHTLRDIGEVAPIANALLTLAERLRVMRGPGTGERYLAAAEKILAPVAEAILEG